MMLEQSYLERALKNELALAQKYIEDLRQTNVQLRKALMCQTAIYDWMCINGYHDIYVAANTAVRMERGDETSK